MRSSTETLIAAMRILSRDIKSTDGIANAAVAEAAERLTELAEAERKSAITLASLRELSRQWKEGADERSEWYVTSDAIDRFTLELDEILEET